MTFLQTFLMWFTPCAFFVAVAYITEKAWKKERASGEAMRRAIEPDTRPELERTLPFASDPLLWNRKEWFTHERR
jgi:hypothetical protein